MADLGMDTAISLIDELRDRVKRKRIEDGREVKRELQSVIADALNAADSAMKLDTVPSVVLVIGVNGVGKTTSIGKLAAYYKAQGKRVVRRVHTKVQALTRRLLYMTHATRQGRVARIYLSVIRLDDYITRRTLWQSLKR